LNGGLEQRSLQDGHYTRNQDNQAGMQIHFAEELKEVHAVVGDERELIYGDPFRHCPVGATTQPEVIHVGSLETGGMGQPD
jgi:hypothetical protein